MAERVLVNIDWKERWKTEDRNSKIRDLILISDKSIHHSDYDLARITSGLGKDGLMENIYDQQETCVCSKFCHFIAATSSWHPVYKWLC